MKFLILFIVCATMGIAMAHQRRGHLNRLNAKVDNEDASFSCLWKCGKFRVCYFLNRDSEKCPPPAGCECEKDLDEHLFQTELSRSPKSLFTEAQEVLEENNFYEEPVENEDDDDDDDDSKMFLASEEALESFEALQQLKVLQFLEQLEQLEQLEDSQDSDDTMYDREAWDLDESFLRKWKDAILAKLRPRKREVYEIALPGKSLDHFVRI